MKRQQRKEAMVNNPRVFGDKNIADIRLHLIDSAGLEYHGNPLYLHSQVLRKAEFFETKLSQRWSSPKPPFEIKVTCCNYHPENYMKFLQLMYSYDTDKRFTFSNVDEALVILPISSEVVYLDCMESCMRYLCAVRWSPEQEAQLRVLLASLQINILPDLAARLGLNQSKPDCGHIEMLKKSLQELLTSNGIEYRGTVECHMFKYFESNTSPAVKDACRYAILKGFNANVEKFKSGTDGTAVVLVCSTLSWLVGVIQIRDAKLFETVVKVFCEDADLRDVIAGRVMEYKPTYDMLTILINQVLKALGDGKVITPVSFRIDFLTNWAPTIAKLMENILAESYDDTARCFLRELEKGIIDVGETVPLVEQRHIYNISKDTFTKIPNVTSGVFNWWALKLQDAVIVDII